MSISGYAYAVAVRYGGEIEPVEDVLGVEPLDKSVGWAAVLHSRLYDAVDDDGAIVDAKDAGGARLVVEQDGDADDVLC